MNARPPHVDLPAPVAPDEEIVGALGKGLILGWLVVFPVLMAVFAVEFGAGITQTIAVAPGVLMMASLLGPVFGMGLFRDDH